MAQPTLLHITNGTNSSNGTAISNSGWGTSTRALISICSAYSTAGTVTHAVSGGGVTWSQVDVFPMGVRRGMEIFESDGTPNGGDITITASGPGAFKETMYSIDEVASWDGTTLIAGSNHNNAISGESISVSVAGSYTSGDTVYAMCAVESGSATGLTVDTGTDLHTAILGGSDVRGLLAADADTDTTPGFSWTTSCYNGILACVINQGTTGSHASGGTDVSANPDALVITERQASIANDVSISAGFDSLTITEYQASINTGVNIDAIPQALIIEEQLAGIALDVAISAGTDALVITEYQAAISAGYNIDANNDALVITEHRSNIGIALSGQSDALVITEHSATISNDISISAGHDTLVLTEYQSDIAYGVNVLASPDSLSITENQASIANDVGISANNDALVITERQAIVSTTLDTILEATADSLVITENQASVANDVSISAGTDSLVITGNAANIQFGVNILASYDTLAITEHQSALTLDVGITAGSDSLVITEHQSSIGIPTVSTGSGGYDESEELHEMYMDALKLAIYEYYGIQNYIE
jgi:hypothetical protein